MLVPGKPGYSEVLSFEEAFLLGQEPILTLALHASNQNRSVLWVGG